VSLRLVLGILALVSLYSCTYIQKKMGVRPPKAVAPERSRGVLDKRVLSMKLPGDVPIPAEDTAFSAAWILKLRKQINGLHHDCDDFLAPIERDFKWRPGTKDPKHTLYIDKDAADKEWRYFETLEEAALYYIISCREKRAGE